MPTAALVAADEKVREELRDCLSRLGVRLVVDQPALLEWSAFMGRLRRLTPDLLVIDSPQFQDPFVGAAHAIKSLSPGPTVIGVIDKPDAEAALKAIRAGANECVMPPFEASLREALDRICRLRAAREREQLPAGKAIGFLSAKGGCGATTVACHVAVGLRQATQHEVLLADLDLDLGMAGFLMKAQTPYSVVDVANRLNSLDFRSWGEMVWKDPPRLDVLPAPATPLHKDLPDPALFRGLLQAMQSQYGWVIADLGRGLSHLTRAVTEELDRLFLVFTPDVPSLYRTKQVVLSLSQNGHSPNRLALILNRVPKHCEFTRKDIEGLLGVRVFWELSERFEHEQAFREGSLVAADSPSCRQLAALTAMIADIKPVELQSQYSIFSLKKLLPERFGA